MQRLKQRLSRVWQPGHTSSACCCSWGRLAQQTAGKRARPTLFASIRLCSVASAAACSFLIWSALLDKCLQDGQIQEPECREAHVLYARELQGDARARPTCTLSSLAR